MRYGFVGLGNLGLHLAVNLTRGGFDVGVNDLRRGAAEPVLAAGARWMESIAELAEGQRLPDHLPALAGGDRRGVGFGAARHEPGEHLDRNEHQRLCPGRGAGRARRKTGDLTLACPVTGGVHRAEARITVLVGGAQPVFAVHEAALKAMGGRVIYLGGIEQATVTKVVTNMLAFIHLIAAGEALMLCAKAGVDLRSAFDAIAASSAITSP